MTNSLTLQGMLKLVEFEDHHNVMLYRHNDHKHRAWERYPAATGIIDVAKVYADGVMLEFQSANGRNVLGRSKVLFFVGEGGRLARFIGGYKIIEHFPPLREARSEIAKKANELDFYDYKTSHWWDFEEINSVHPLIDRLVVEWPLGRSANRKLVKNIELVELRPEKAQSPFPGFNRLLLSFPKLRQLVGPSGDASWKQVLQSTRGVYLISHTQSGDLYIGSATGGGGFLQRWQEYALSGHGNNKLIKLGIDGGTIDPDYFQLSVLETLSNLATRGDGLRAEQVWKEKLGNKAITLNDN